jgi:macrolide resistance protein
MRTVRLRLPVYGVLVAGGFSRLGNAVAGVALPWFVLTLTNSPGWTGIAAAVGMVPLIIGALVGGSLVDRLGSRFVAVTADLFSAVSIAAIPLLYLGGALGLAPLLALIVLGALLDGPGMTAQESRYPELARLARLRLEQVMALDELVDNGAMIAGPVIAGLAIAAFGPELTLWITAGCSLVAGLLNLAFVPRHRPIRTSRGTEPNDMLVGVRFLFGDPLLRAILLFGMVVLAVFGALDAVVMPVFIRESGRAVSDLGWFLAAAGGGAVAGAFCYAGWGHQISRRATLTTCLAVEAGALFLLARQPSSVGLLAAGALAGFAAGPLGPLVSTTLLRRAPSAIRAHVLGASTAVALTATPLAVLLSGAAIEIVGTQPMMFGGAGVLCIMACVAFALPALRLPDETVTPSLEASDDQ